VQGARPSPEPYTIRRIVYKEISNADRKKFIAQSNSTPSGGGARDIRISPYSAFDDVFSRLFPRRSVKRTKANAQTTVYVGTFSWLDNGAVRQMDSEFKPPTLSRPSDGYITNVHKQPCFANVPGTNEGMVLMLLVQDTDQSVWPYLVTENALRGWKRSVADKIFACIAAKRPGTLVSGYIDLETGQDFCNGS
jgi:hypothetical protein